MLGEDQDNPSTDYRAKLADTTLPDKVRANSNAMAFVRMK